jgi:hypothetical protein
MIKYIILKISYDTKDPQKTFDENIFKIRKSIDYNNIKNIHFLLQGDNNKIQILEVTEYYTELLSLNTNFNYLIVLDQVIDEKNIINIDVPQVIENVTKLPPFSENSFEKYSYTGIFYFFIK